MLVGDEDRERAREPPRMHERRIEIRWSDLDAYAHVYHPVYLT